MVKGGQQTASELAQDVLAKALWLGKLGIAQIPADAP
jgi:hypothetical protein